MKKYILLLIITLLVTPQFSYSRELEETETALSEIKTISVGYQFNLPVPMGLSVNLWLTEKIAVEYVLFAINVTAKDEGTGDNVSELLGNHAFRFLYHFGSGDFNRFFSGIAFGEWFTKAETEMGGTKYEIAGVTDTMLSLFIGREKYSQIEDIEQRATSFWQFGISLYPSPEGGYIILPYVGWGKRYYL